jgi:hypothetical protein
MTVEAKHAAAEAAAGANDVAAALTTLAGIAGVVAVLTGGVGGGAAAALGVGSGIAWWIANEYGDLALDPPRHDYHLVTKFKPRHVELLRAESEIETIWNEFSHTQAELAEALAALTTSLERLGGARLDLRRLGAEADLLAHRITTQRQAIRHNAAAAKRRIHVLLGLRSRVNAAWRAYTDLLCASAKSISHEELERALAKLWSEIMPTLHSALGADHRLSRIQPLIEHAKLTTLTIPDEVLDDRWSAGMLGMAKRLAALAGEKRLTFLRHELG